MPFPLADHRPQGFRDFKLTDKFIEDYKDKQPKWGFGALSYVVYKRSYARTLENGSTEEFWQTIRRVVEGTYNIQKLHCAITNIPWNNEKAQKSAQKMYDLMWNFKFLPSGRGLEHMGTDYIYTRGGACLRSCAFCSTENIALDYPDPFVWAMDMLFLGAGVGFDTRGAGSRRVKEPRRSTDTFLIPDSREGWVEAVRLLLEAYTGKGFIPQFDFSAIRLKGTPIKTFGGICPGPAPLIELIGFLEKLYTSYIDKKVDSTLIVDTMNYIGRCVVSGGKRRTSEIALGAPDDLEFADLKLNEEAFRERRWASNNAIFAHRGMDYGQSVERTIQRGEPSWYWIENARNFGRFLDPPTKKDIKIMGLNPCFHGETLIAVADGRNTVSIKTLAEKGEDVPVYSVNKEGIIEIKWGRNPRITGYEKKLLRVTLDDNSHIDVTPNHKFLLTDGNKKEAKDLVEKDSLSRFSKVSEFIVRGHKQYCRVYTNTLKSKKDKIFEHKLIAKFHNPKIWEELYDDSKESGWLKGGLVVHHNDYNSLNNSPDNLVVMTFRDHQQLHARNDNIGENNGKYSGHTNKQLEEEALKLTRILNRRFSADEWEAHALSIGAPKSFSSWRQQDWFASPLELSKWAAEKLNLDFINLDPRVVKTYTSLLNKGYVDVTIQDGKVFVKKICKECSNEFTIESVRREVECCSIQCGSLVGVRSEKRVTNLKKKFAETGRQRLCEQISLYKSLQDQLDRVPKKEEFIAACKAIGLPYRQRSNNATKPYHIKNYKDLKARAKDFNHRVKKVEALEGLHTVYNITVDDNHTVSVVTDQHDNKYGNPIYNGINVLQCGEQGLHDRECCSVLDIVPNNHDTIEEFLETCKYAYLYGKTLTLIETHNAHTNAVEMRNRRIGLGHMGIAQITEKLGRHVYRQWCDAGYKRIKELDRIYSDWFCIPLSIKMTTSKPNGCRPWDGLTCTDQGLLTLEELFELSDHQENETWHALPTDIVASGSENHITKTYANGKSDIYRINMTYGLSVESTSNHKWFVTKHYDRKQKIRRTDINDWVQTQNISPGDILDIDLRAYNKTTHTKLEDHRPLALTMRGKSNPITCPTHMDEDLAWLLGYLWGDGALSLGGLRIRFVDINIDNLEKAKSIIKDKFSLCDSNIRSMSGDNKASTLEIGSKHLWHWFIKNGFWKYYANELDLIPKAVRTSSRSDILAFIAGLVDADGCAVLTPAGSGKFILSSAYDLFSNHLQQVCMSVGLCIGRSLNSKGKNKQKQKHIWLMGSSKHIDPESFNILLQNCNKLQALQKKEGFKQWHHEYNNGNNNSLILGKVVSVEYIGEENTYDAEVESSHWYRAGSIKSHNSTALLVGATPGPHYPQSLFYIRRVRIEDTSPLIPALRKAGYDIEISITEPNTFILSFPIKTVGVSRTVQDVTMWEQLLIAADIQKYWSDNQVSVTVTFKKEEEKDIVFALEHFEDKLKSVSLLPLFEMGSDPKDYAYQQVPYQPITEEEYNTMCSQISEIDFSAINGNTHEESEKFCTNDLCLL